MAAELVTEMPVVPVWAVTTVLKVEQVAVEQAVWVLLPRTMLAVKAELVYRVLLQELQHIMVVVADREALILLAHQSAPVD